MAHSFRCTTCNKVHSGLPSFGPDAPDSYYVVPESERADRCDLGSDDCIIDNETFFVRACLEIPVHSIAEPIVWLVWCSLSLDSYKQWAATFDQKLRSDTAPLFGWLNTRLPFYEDTLNLKTMLHLRDDGLRPFVQLEPTDHSLAVAQRDGISVEVAEEMVTKLLHPDM